MPYENPIWCERVENSTKEQDLEQLMASIEELTGVLEQRDEKNRNSN